MVRGERKRKVTTTVRLPEELHTQLYNRLGRSGEVSGLFEDFARAYLQSSGTDTATQIAETKREIGELRKLLATKEALLFQLETQAREAEAKAMAEPRRLEGFRLVADTVTKRLSNKGDLGFPDDWRAARAEETGIPFPRLLAAAQEVAKGATIEEVWARLNGKSP